RLRLDQHRAATTSRVLSRVPHDFITSNHVIAVDDVGGNTITRRFLGEIPNRSLQAGRSRIGVLIVLGDDDQRQPLYGGEVESFVKSASAHAAVADICHGYKLLLLHPRTQQDS